MIETELLLNNGYKKSHIDRIIKQKEQHNTNNTNNNNNNGPNSIIIYYQNTMSSTYKTDKKIMKRLINNNVKTVDTKDLLKYRICYTNNKTSSLILKNNCIPKPDSIIKCKIGECEH